MKTLCKHASPWMATLLMVAGCAGEIEDMHRDTTATAPAEAEVVSEIPAAAVHRQTEVTESAPTESTVTPLVEVPGPKVPTLTDGSDIVLMRVLEQLAELRQSQLKTVHSDADSKK